MALSEEEFDYAMTQIATRFDYIIADGLRSHDREQRAEIKRLKAVICEIGSDGAFVRGDWDCDYCEVRISMATWQAARRLAEEKP